MFTHSSACVSILQRLCPYVWPVLSVVAAAYIPLCAVCLLATQVYHAWNQLRTLGMPVRSWPSIMAAVVAELLAENPIRGRLMLGAALWAMQVSRYPVLPLLQTTARQLALLQQPSTGPLQLQHLWLLLRRTNG